MRKEISTPQDHQHTWFTHTTGIAYCALSLWSCAPNDLRTFARFEVSPNEYSTRQRAAMESMTTSLIAPLLSSTGRRWLMMFLKSSCIIKKYAVINSYLTTKGLSNFKPSGSNISSVRRSVSSPDEMLRRELKIGCTGEYFRGTLRCFIGLWNAVFNAWHYFSNNMIFEGEFKDAKISSFSSDFHTLI